MEKGRCLPKAGGRGVDEADVVSREAPSHSNWQFKFLGLLPIRSIGFHGEREGGEAAEPRPSSVPGTRYLSTSTKEKVQLQLGNISSRNSQLHPPRR